MTQRHAACGIARIEVLVGLIVLAVGGVVLVPMWGNSRIAQKREQCLSNLERIGRALNAYLDENNQIWPCVAKLRSMPLHDPAWPTISEVLGRYVDNDGKAFVCPADRRTLADDHPLVREFGRRTTWWQTEGASYEWLMGEAYGGKKVGEEVLSRAGGFGMGRADMPLITEFEPFHAGDAGGSFNTLNADLKPRTARDNVHRD